MGGSWETAAKMLEGRTALAAGLWPNLSFRRVGAAHQDLLHVHLPLVRASR
jgi:hypothetical protein